MMLYLSFPVAMFWISNQAEYFEEYIVKRKVRNAGLYVELHLLHLGTLVTNVLFFLLWRLLWIQREIFPPHEGAHVSFILHIQTAQLHSYTPDVWYLATHIWQYTVYVGMTCLYI